MLNKRHKIKLRELAKRIHSTEEIYDVTFETVNDATAEIEEVLSKFDPSLIRKRTTSTELAPLSSFDQFEGIFDDILRESSENTKKNENFTSDPSDDAEPEDERVPQGIDEAVIPSWAKKIRKEISKKCHPDMLPRLDIPEWEKEERRKTLVRMHIAIEDQDWDLILALGINLDIYTDELPPMNQKRRIQKVFQRFSKETNKLRESISYRWSEEWGNLEFKVQVVELFLQKKGLPIPDRIETIKKIKDFEDLF